MSSRCSLEHLKYKLWPKEGPGVKLPVWLPTTKSWESTRFTWLQGGVPHTIGKHSTRATTLLQTALRSEVYSQSYGAPKSRESHLGRFRDSHLVVPREKSHLDVASMANHKVYYKGEGGKVVVSPKSGPWGESCVSVLPVARPSTKGAPTMH